MKAIVLCAGLGTRLRPLTDTTPKSMIDIAGEPLLHHHLRSLRVAGVTEVAVNLHHLADLVKSGTGDGPGFGMRIRYHEERELLGSAGALNGFPGFFDEPFFVIYGDVYHEIDLRELAYFHAMQRATLSMAVHTVDDPTTKGVVRIQADTGRVLAFVEKPTDAPPDSLVNAGIYVCQPVVAALIPPGMSDFGSDVVPSLIASGEPVYALPTPSLVQDIGTPEGLDRARKLAKRNPPA